MPAAQFLVDLWSSQGPGYFCLSTKTKSGRWRDHFFKSPIKLETIESFIDEHNSSNLYFCITPLTQRRRRKEYVKPTQYMWADLDAIDPRQIKPSPQIAWQTSPGRYSAIWRLNSKINPRIIEQRNRGLTYAVGADKGGWDLGQVLRIPFTRNYKYAGSPLGKMLWRKDNAYSLDKMPQNRVPSGSLAKDLLKKYKSRMGPSLYKLLADKRLPDKGKRSDVLWRLENGLNEAGVPKSDIYTLIKFSVWNKFAGQVNEDEQLDREVNKLPKLTKKKTYINGTPIVVRMDRIQPEKVSWIWRPYIPQGKVTLLEGDPGLGKSWLSLSLASDLSASRRLQQQGRIVSGNILLMSAEDGLADTIRPRLDQMKANHRHIYAYNAPITFDDEGKEHIEGQIILHHPILVIIDPLVAYMDGIDLHKANETRQIMAWLAYIAGKHRVAILAVRHLTKGSRDKSIYRGIGSIDLTAAARSVLLIAQDPEDEDARIIIQHKSNLARKGSSLKYELVPQKGNPFHWVGPVDFTAEDAMRIKKADGQGAGSEYLAAKKFLEKNLPSKLEKLRRDSEARGISFKILRRAADEMKVRKTPAGWSLDQA